MDTKRLPRSDMSHVVCWLRQHDLRDESVQKTVDRYRMYIDKLDGGVSQDQFDRMSESFRQEQRDLLRHIEKHQQANQTYLDEGVHLLELAQKAVVLSEKQDMREKRRLLDFVCSNAQWRDGRLIPTYRKPFDLLASTNLAYTKTRAASPVENGSCPGWLPGPDSNQRPIG
jgi:site-specific DNA recombinase